MNYPTYDKSSEREAGVARLRELAALVNGTPSNIQEVIEQCLQDSINWFPDNADDLTFMTLAMFGEVGEGSNWIKKVARGSHMWGDLVEKDGRTQTVLEWAVEEFIDAFIYLCNIFGLMRVDPIMGYNVKRAINAERFGKHDGE